MKIFFTGLKIDILLVRNIHVGNQLVLLQGINNSTEIMMELIKKLVKIRVRPYYLYQTQALAGKGHFIVSIDRELDIIKGLREWK